MKKKINKMLVLIAGLAIFFTMLLLTVVYYDLFRRQVMEDLRAYTLLLKEYEDPARLKGLADRLENDDIRLTLIGENGDVVFDSRADLEKMENHSQRPEIIKALSEGEGQAVRRSKTLSENTFYYAVRLEGGDILRVAKEASSIYNVFLRALPSLIMILLVLLVLCLAVARVLTAKLISPIERLAENLDEYDDKTDYEELTPFIAMIKSQHQDIMKNAKMRQEFTANVSHKLKTPLTSISGYAELRRVWHRSRMWFVLPTAFITVPIVFLP